MPSREALEVALRRYVYAPGPPKDALVEDMRFTGMARTFLRMTEARVGYPPTQHDYTVVVLHELGQQRTPEVVGRIGRAWISFVVQWHAYITLDEICALARWDVNADTNYGVDVIAFDDSEPDAWVPVGLALRVAGHAGVAYAARKNGRHRSAGFAVRELECDKHEHRVGPFWLISPERLARTVKEAADETRTERRRRDFWEGFDEGQAEALKSLEGAAL